MMWCEDFVSNQIATVSVEAAWLQPLLDRVNTAGSIEAYLQSHGVTQAQIDSNPDDGPAVSVSAFADVPC